MKRQTAPVRTTRRQTIKEALIDKPIPTIAPTPRVQEETRTVPTDTMTQKTTPTPRVLRNTKQAPPTIAQSKIHNKIREATSNRARLPL